MKSKIRPSEHQIEIVTTSPLCAACSCGDWVYRAWAGKPTVAQAILHVQRWHEWHVKYERRRA